MESRMHVPTSCPTNCLFVIVFLLFQVFVLADDVVGKLLICLFCACVFPLTYPLSQLHLQTQSQASPENVGSPSSIPCPLFLIEFT